MRSFDAALCMYVMNVGTSPCAHVFLAAVSTTDSLIGASSQPAHFADLFGEEGKSKCCKKVHTYLRTVRKYILS